MDAPASEAMIIVDSFDTWRISFLQKIYIAFFSITILAWSPEVMLIEEMSFPSPEGIV